MAKLYVGLSGFSYKDWQGEGLLYPPSLPSKEFFKFYSARYNALEGVGMWYSLPSENSIREWCEVSPPDFRVSPKMHKNVTHISRLKPSGFGMLEKFLDAVEPLNKADRLGPILVQLPPNLKRDDELLLAFIAEASKRPGVRWCFEFRNESWQSPDVEEILRANNAGWVGEDTDEEPAQRRDTADYVYVRLRKIEYSDEELVAWTSFFTEKVKQGKDCFVYCRHKDTFQPWKWADRILQVASK